MQGVVDFLRLDMAWLSCTGWAGWGEGGWQEKVVCICCVEGLLWLAQLTVTVSSTG